MESVGFLYSAPWWAAAVAVQACDGSIGSAQQRGLAARLASAEGQVASPPRPVAAPDAPAADPVVASRPYRGEFRGVTWNSQALFSTCPSRYEAKRRVMMQLAGAHDFVMLQETHSTPGAVKAWVEPAGFTYFYLHGTRHRNGVGILVNNKFLARFDPPRSRALEAVEPERVGALRLQGPVGRLDLFVVYAETGDARDARQGMRERLGRAIVPPTQALSMVAGDWNYVALTEDRFSADPLRWTGGQQGPEEDHFQAVMGRPHSLIEFEQMEPTNFSGTGRARLDRAYANFGKDAQLDHGISCVVLPRPGRVSTHCPLSFMLQPPDREAGTPPPISSDVIRQPEWPERVRLSHAELIAAEPADRPASGNRRLVLLKRAMRQVSTQMWHEQRAAKNRGCDDRLSVVLRFLRAWDQGRYGAVRQLASQCGLGRDLESANRWSHRGELAVTMLRQEAMSLARAAYVDELREAQAAAATSPPAQQLCRRGQLMTRLRRLRPGASTVLSAIRDADGTIRHDAAGMAEALRRHWSSVFADKHLREDDMQRWLEECYPAGTGLEGLPAKASPQWRLRRRDVSRAVQTSGSSSPGPDGLPYLAWRQLRGYGIDALWDALRELEMASGTDLMEQAYADEAGCNFNLSLLVCIPKVTGGQTITAEDTRPLSMVDTSNRLLASAARLRWECALGSWIDSAQKGFLPGRSLLSNVVELEHQAMLTSLDASEGALVLLDFAAAFPSVSQQYLKKALAHIGMPTSALNLLAAFYHKTECVVQVGRGRFEGFELRSGIRQGCPLSPLLFVAAMDGLLRAIPTAVPQGLARAFADDTAVLLRDLKAGLPPLHGLFARLALATGLRLNMRKCVIIPLGDRGLNPVSAFLERTFSPWFGAKVAMSGRYLGFEIGPARGGASWVKPTQKARERIATWPWAELGLFYGTQVWNTLVVSLYSYVGQLELPPAAVLQDEEMLLRKAAPGPGNWCGTAELHRLRRQFGFAGEFKSLDTALRAARYRVACKENLDSGGLHVRSRARELAAARRTTQHVVREARWLDWYAAAHCTVLSRTLQEFEAQGITEGVVEAEAAGSRPRPWSVATMNLVCKTFQRTARRLWEAGDRYNAEQWTRHKLHRWGLRDRRQATRSLDRLRALAQTVPPRVMAATLGCVWNRWATARRRQRRGCPCLLGCGSGEDSIEHYACCRITREAARRWLGLHFRFSAPLEHWMLAAPTCAEVEASTSWWARIALLQYAVHRTTNAVRHSGGPQLPEEEVMGAVRQGLLEAVRGHAAAARLVA